MKTDEMKTGSSNSTDIINFVLPVPVNRSHFPVAWLGGEESYRRRQKSRYYLRWVMTERVPKSPPDRGPESPIAGDSNSSKVESTGFLA